MDELLPATAPGALFIDCSTIDVDTALSRLAAEIYGRFEAAGGAADFSAIIKAIRGGEAAAA